MGFHVTGLGGAKNGIKEISTFGFLKALILSHAVFFESVVIILCKDLEPCIWQLVFVL